MLQGMMAALPGAVAQGVLFGIMALGVYLTYRILDIADLTVDGSFALGGCICAICIVKGGMDPLLAVFISLAAGSLAGMITGILHAIFDIPAILAGILTQLALYSINLRIMGRSNQSLLNETALPEKVQQIFPGISQTTGSLLIGIATVLVVIVVLYWFFGTEVGSEIRATGNNEAMVKALGGNTRLMKVFGLMLSNALVAVSGALVAQTQGYADVGMGQGQIVIGLAAIVIGSVLLGWGKSFGTKMASAVIGSVIYRIIIAIVLQLRIVEPTDLKMFSAGIVALALAVPVLISRYKNRPKVERELPILVESVSAESASETEEVSPEAEEH